MSNNVGPLQSQNSNNKGVCAVCKDDAQKSQFGLFVCDLCTTFFEQARESEQIECISDGNCPLRSKEPMCEACRLNKCILIGMNEEKNPSFENNSLKPQRKRRSEAARLEEGNEEDENTDPKKSRKAEESMPRRQDLIPTKWTRLNNDMGVKPTDNLDQFIEESTAQIDQLDFWEPDSGEDILIPVRTAEDFKSLVDKHSNCFNVFACAFHVFEENYRRLVEDVKQIAECDLLDNDSQNQLVKRSYIYVHILDFLFAISRDYLRPYYRMPDGKVVPIERIAMFGDPELAASILPLISHLRNVNITETDYRVMRTLLVCDKETFDCSIVKSMYNQAAFLWRRSERDKYKLRELETVIQKLKREIGAVSKKHVAMKGKDQAFRKVVETKCIRPELVCTKITKL